MKESVQDLLKFSAALPCISHFGSCLILKAIVVIVYLRVFRESDQYRKAEADAARLSASRA